MGQSLKFVIKFKNILLPKEKLSKHLILYFKSPNYSNLRGLLFHILYNIIDFLINHHFNMF